MSEPQSSKKKKRQRADECAEEIVSTPSAVNAEPIIAERDVENHKAKLRKALPTREERARRDKQRKIQAFVNELRNKGIVDKKEIKKLKMKFVKTGKSDFTPSLKDRTIECKDCFENFSFPAVEQRFYQSKGFSDPVRCKPCQNAKRERMGDV